jgi:hypothetical protein
MGTPDSAAEDISLVLQHLPKRDGILIEAAVISFEVLVLSVFMNVHHRKGCHSDNAVDQ